jgi:hypothetical protein
VIQLGVNIKPYSQDHQARRWPVLRGQGHDSPAQHSHNTHHMIKYSHHRTSSTMAQPTTTASQPTAYMLSISVIVFPPCEMVPAYPLVPQWCEPVATEMQSRRALW